MHKSKIYWALVLSGLSAIIIAQNTALVETKVLFMTITMPRAALLAITLLTGLVAGFLLTLGWSRKKKPSDPSNLPRK